MVGVDISDGGRTSHQYRLHVRNVPVCATVETLTVEFSVRTSTESNRPTQLAVSSQMTQRAEGLYVIPFLFMNQVGVSSCFL